MDFQSSVRTENHGVAKLFSDVGGTVARIVIDPDQVWTADGLRRIAALLEGAARMIQE